MDLILVLIAIAIGLAVAAPGRGPNAVDMATSELEAPGAETGPETPPPAFAPLPPPVTGDAAPDPVADAKPGPVFTPLPPVTDGAASGDAAKPGPVFTPLPPAANPPRLAPQPAHDFEFEDQTPTGRFTTAAEVRPILEATKDRWIAVREFNGQDLVYFTQLLSWRCGLHRIRFAINDEPLKVYDAEPCHADTATPNAILAETVQPYIALPLNSVQSVEVELLFDDLSTAGATFQRPLILIP